MLEWLNNNSGALSTIASFCTLAVWLFYAQLLYLGFARQRRPRIIINRGLSKSPDGMCLISNMSSEAIFVSNVMGVLHTSQGEYACDLTDYTRTDNSGEEQHEEHATRQGPLASGDYHKVCSFREIIDHIAEGHQLNIDRNSLTLEEEMLRMLEIRLIAIYGSENRPVGAYRCFMLEKKDLDPNVKNQDCHIIPTSFDTHRLSRRWHQKRIRKWLEALPNQR
ncbi:hypothetical protein C8E00_101512 [Chromohalobacter marismortui]|uniref:Uncharacterized protein n=1 Tax=Chromohalobacter marismortui TaxID=42055 RepID=A0A4R7NX64_9GAMM|nr:MULTISPECIES: hypothetical protein [Chromohalobacter]MCI0510305.1 hypothetical protein [Chromohalobacter sp.]MCI0594000.1 hypothetical protein [Chromohalobacter sp.]TDU25120.1 hypothetical protein C8E00_101512 [Chromohalobacter marismortui]